MNNDNISTPPTFKLEKMFLCGAYNIYLTKDDDDMDEILSALELNNEDCLIVYKHDGTPIVLIKP